jgi:hypothetical protein
MADKALTNVVGWSVRLRGLNHFRRVLLDRLRAPRIVLPGAALPEQQCQAR